MVEDTLAQAQPVENGRKRVKGNKSSAAAAPLQGGPVSGAQAGDPPAHDGSRDLDRFTEVPRSQAEAGQPAERELAARPVSPEAALVVGKILADDRVARDLGEIVGRLREQLSRCVPSARQANYPLPFYLNAPPQSVEALYQLVSHLLIDQGK